MTSCDSKAPRFTAWEDAVKWLRDQSDQCDLVRSAYYDDPLPEAAERYRQSEEWSDIRSLLPPMQGQALDVGAGRGIASYALAHEGFSVTALEPDSSALIGAEAIRSLAASSRLPIQVIQDFSESLPFPDGTFDLVFARAVLHHTRDLNMACAEFFRVLKPGGRLLAVREHVISRIEDLDAFLKVHPLHQLYGGENAFRLEEYENAIIGAGFRIERTLDPLESAINFAPHTLSSLKRQIAAKATRNLPGITDLVVLALSLPSVWSRIRHVLSRLDHRPGRLYSFVANRPP